MEENQLTQTDWYLLRKIVSSESQLFSFFNLILLGTVQIEMNVMMEVTLVKRQM